MDLAGTTASATQAYTIASRFQPLGPTLPSPGQSFTKLTQVAAPTAPTAPPAAPPAPPANPPLLDVTGAGAVPAGGPTGQTGSALGPRYDAAGLPALPPPPTPQAAPVTPAPTPTVAPPPTLAPANTVDLATTLDQTAPLNLATVNRATDLYNQIQQLVPAAPPPAAPPAPAPTPVQQAQPTALSAALSAAPTAPASATPTADAVNTSPVQNQQIGTVGISSLGGAAGSSTALLGFARGTFLNVLA